MPQLILNPDCYKIMDGAGVTDVELCSIAQSPDHWWADAGNTRLTLAKWTSNDRMLFVDGTINHMVTIEGKLYVDRMTPLVVFALRPELPAGRITRDRDIEEIMALVAESFGVPVRCHEDEPFSTLYSGPWNGKNEIERERVVVSHGYAYCGAFERDPFWAYRVYSIDLTKYLDWAKRHFQSST